MGEMQRPRREGEDKRRDERGWERVTGCWGDGWGGYERGAEPRVLGRCHWEGRGGNERWSS